MSEVAQVKAQIAQGHNAYLRGLSRLACVASHETITVRMKCCADRIRRLIETGRETEAGCFSQMINSGRNSGRVEERMGVYVSARNERSVHVHSTKEVGHNY